MFKKIINENKPTEWNIFIYSILACICFILTTTPIIIFVSFQNPEMVEVLKSDIPNVPQVLLKINQIILLIEFLSCGTLMEFIRQRKTTGMESKKITKILIYFCFEMLFIIILKFIGGVIK